MATVALKTVRKVYAGGMEAVKGVELSVPDGALCVLVGPSGCGKSTLLRMIAGLEDITTGTIEIDGRVVNALEPAERDIAMVFQNYALYPHMSVYDNMAYGLRNRGTPKPEIERKVREAARMLELGSLLDRRPRQLSGGQRQRVAMGRAIVRDPKVFLFDEPLSNLDAKLRGQMRVEIRRLQRDLGVTSIYVTHDQLEAMTLADVLVVMNSGRIEQVGAPLDVYEEPATTFVASFIGAPPMNLLAPDRLSAVGAALEGVLPAGAVTVGIRPEDLGTPEMKPERGITFDVTIDVLEPVGAESYLYARIQDAPIVVRLPGRAAVPETGKLKVAAPFDKLHFFDADGKRVQADASAQKAAAGASRSSQRV
ncbi:sn-glycerol 3-phosphate ABC transporter ATP binding subunit [Hyphomicrobiales bacterium]|nr:sn-glycerol 3-phosphate ABC transporter ATP binding subunit [Hyphomicrobiales bacterium]CAH1664924.1 sn-glycerol 3-phosphate ABC transporter ATP binding subunit [Hyphomicrobiales bacterium]